jgi:hypothetical protein
MRAVILLLLTGCATQIREARAVQPNPVQSLGSADQLAVSEPLYVFTRDSTEYRDALTAAPGRASAIRQESGIDTSGPIPRYWQFRSGARFAVINRDRVRFHLAVARHDEREADTRNWKVWLEDESGRKLLPSSREVAQMDRLQLPWSMYFDFANNRYWKQREVPGWDAYQGRADYVFNAPGLLDKERQWLALVAEKGGYQMRFTWKFDEGSVQVTHFGRSKVDDEIGVMIAPSEDTKVAQTWYEGEEP